MHYPLGCICRLHIALHSININRFGINFQPLLVLCIARNDGDQQQNQDAVGFFPFSGLHSTQPID
ncbi:hypothetical protein NIASO_15450 [Niabella soli DSM 19437]|uniref:Uncharacterized protein n=1 Tax=Niabella soli DSM 19437 TaxID=929713 RepID=W0F8R6_9BACT|nr:hypothetical protein NIASO_15450 [Niabella soli DSM 19437]